MAIVTLGNLTAEQKQYYDLKLLYRARKAQIFYDFAMGTDLPENHGNNVSWRRFEALSLATTPLVEAQTPEAAGVDMTEIVGFVQQYGNFIYISDALDKLAIDKIMTQAVEALGQNAGESVEQLFSTVLGSGSNVAYATGTSRSSQGVGNPLTLALLQKAVANLDTNNTMRFSGEMENKKISNGSYVGFVHPAVVWDLKNDTTVKNYWTYDGAGDRAMEKGFIGKLDNVEFYQSTLCPVYAGAGSGGANVYGTIIAGQNAFGRVNAAGNGKFEMFVNPIGSSGSADPLHQRGSVGWKAWQCPIILNNNFMVRIESGATIG
jgi:N4-gp56 family major capsid protein